MTCYNTNFALLDGRATAFLGLLSRKEAQKMPKKKHL